MRKKQPFAGRAFKFAFYLLACFQLTACDDSSDGDGDEEFMEQKYYFAITYDNRAGLPNHRTYYVQKDGIYYSDNPENELFIRDGNIYTEDELESRLSNVVEKRRDITKSEIREMFELLKQVDRTYGEGSYSSCRDVGTNAVWGFSYDAVYKNYEAILLRESGVDLFLNSSPAAIELVEWLSDYYFPGPCQ